MSKCHLDYFNLTLLDGQIETSLFNPMRVFSWGNRIVSSVEGAGVAITK